MKQKTTAAEFTSRVCYEMMEVHARSSIQRWLQQLLEEEVTEFLGRAKSQRRGELEQPHAGLPQRLRQAASAGLDSGTVTVRRPRVRNLEQRFESRVLPLFKRRSNELGAMLPQLYLHGLASGDFELALRGLLGEGVPLSATFADAAQEPLAGGVCGLAVRRYVAALSWCIAGPTVCKRAQQLVEKGSGRGHQAAQRDAVCHQPLGP